MLASIHRSRNLHSLVVDKSLTAIDEVFPLCASTLYYLFAALHILHSLAPAALDKNTGLICDLTCANANVLGAILGRGYDIFSCLAAALGRIQNTYECSNSQTRQEPSKCLLIFVCHKATPFTKT
jgi:hypothetical protein